MCPDNRSEYLFSEFYKGVETAHLIMFKHDFYVLV